MTTIYEVGAERRQGEMIYIVRRRYGSALGTPETVKEFVPRKCFGRYRFDIARMCAEEYRDAIIENDAINAAEAAEASPGIAARWPT